MLGATTTTTVSTCISCRVIYLYVRHFRLHLNAMVSLLRMRRQVCDRHLPGKRHAQIAQERVEADGSARPLKESPPARLFRKFLQRPRSVADEDRITRRLPAHARHIKRVDGDAVGLRLLDGARRVDALPRLRAINPARNIQAVGDDEHRAPTGRQRLKPVETFAYLDVRIEGSGARRAYGDAQCVGRSLKIGRELLAHL